jgi:hypothetical protein
MLLGREHLLLGKSDSESALQFRLDVAKLNLMLSSDRSQNRYRQFEFTSLRLRSEGLSGDDRKKRGWGGRCARHRHRRELKCQGMPRHFDFLSVGQEFGADARAIECSERLSASAIRAVARCAG